MQNWKKKYNQGVSQHITSEHFLKKIFLTENKNYTNFQNKASTIYPKTYFFCHQCHSLAFLLQLWDSCWHTVLPCFFKSAGIRCFWALRQALPLFCYSLYYIEHNDSRSHHSFFENKISCRKKEFVLGCKQSLRRNRFFSYGSCCPR